MQTFHQEKRKEWIHTGFQKAWSNLSFSYSTTQCAPLAPPPHPPLKIDSPSHLRETSVTSGAFIPCHTKEVYVNKMLNASWGTTAELQCRPVGFVGWITYHGVSGLNHISSLRSDPTFHPGGFCTPKLNHETFWNSLLSVNTGFQKHFHLENKTFTAS